LALLVTLQQLDRHIIIHEHTIYMWRIHEVVSQIRRTDDEQHVESSWFTDARH